jgi:hypothetical protein
MLPLPELLDQLEALQGQQVIVQALSGEPPAAVLAVLRGPLGAVERRQMTDEDQGDVIVLTVGLVDQAVALIEEAAFAGAFWVEEGGGPQLRIRVADAELWLYFERPPVTVESP